MRVLCASEIIPQWRVLSLALLLEHVTFSNETVTRQNPLSRPHDKSYDIRGKECAITRDCWLQLCNYTVYVFIVL